MNTTTMENNNGKSWKLLGLAGIVVLAIAFVIGIWGFFGKTETTSKTNASGQTPNAAQNNHVKKSSVLAEKVPAALTDAGEFGENIYDAAKANDWKTANAKLNELKAAAEKMAGEKIGSAAFEATLGKLEKAAAAKDKTSTLIEANQLTLDAANLTAKYNPPVPVEVVKLDFYGRELEIWSQAKDEAKLRETARMIRQNWDAVKSKIEARGGKKEAAAFENLVVKTDRARTSADYAKLAAPILDEVDNLEKVFA
jgi:hypothetical protein